ncbi:hypothetical protein T07_4918 [Trichinella nelsoni]|uniref:Uncharacterized protein n=1 Tax=Trichinella nelsoni TaxID=6336 RepID=A0A0V0RV45_9BILA|nr:hypothetical protein T07_4918 [Trichinella nelsoni]
MRIRKRQIFRPPSGHLGANFPLPKEKVSLLQTVQSFTLLNLLMLHVEGQRYANLLQKLSAFKGIRLECVLIY